MEVPAWRFSRMGAKNISLVYDWFTRSGLLEKKI
jgi:hypothetical protein